MDPVTTTVLTKAGTETVELIKKESDSFLIAVLGEPAKAFGGLIADKINARRHANLVKITAAAKRRLADAGVSPKEVSLKIIHPMLEAASLEEDSDLQERYANLLANAADPRELTPVGAMFSAILKDLGPREVSFLDALYSNALERAEASPLFKNVSQMAYERTQLWTFYEDLEMSPEKGSKEADENHFWLMLDIIRRHEVLREVYMEDTEGGQRALARQYHFSDLGAAFVLACRDPTR